MVIICGNGQWLYCPEWRQSVMIYITGDDEQPLEEIKRYVEQELDKTEWKVDAVLSHTTP